MGIVFGSPEAKEILAKDKELQRREEEEAKRNSREWIDQRIEELEDSIEMAVTELAGYRFELEELQEKRSTTSTGA